MENLSVFCSQIIAGQYLNMIKSWLDEKNDLLLSELCDRLRETTGTSVSITTTHRALEKLGLRHKKSLNASEQETPLSDRIMLIKIKAISP
ncbi:hypothetical protein U9R62_08965 [Cylindrospermopsis raciborskii DSH]|uniref:hypothetical protein n=1 Tax=Cylindrospermopsis raciborskii TaxID=77022 RepID=UPI002ED99EF3